MKEILESNSELMFGEVPFQGAMLDYKGLDTCKMERLGFKPEIDFPKGIKLTKEWIVGKKNDNQF